jgi:hypothetical protein
MRGEIRWDTSPSASDWRHRSERTPVKSFRQALWGGWIHAKCRCEVDKWGRLTTRHISLRLIEHKLLSILVNAVPDRFRRAIFD